MLLKAQRIEHQQRHSTQPLYELTVDGLAIGDIGHATNLETQNRQLVMQHRNGLYSDAGTLKSIVIVNFHQFVMWHARIGVLCKAIGKAAVQSSYHIMASIDREVAETTQLLKTAYVVVVDVSNEQRIEVSVASAENLLTKVGSTVYQDALAAPLNQCRLPQTLVTRVARTTHLALAPYLWHTSAGAAA